MIRDYSRREFDYAYLDVSFLEHKWQFLKARWFRMDN